MKTYQDMLAAGESRQARMDFIRQAITDHRSSDLYQTAVIADEYDRMENRTITEYRRILYNLQGEAVDDQWSANYQIPSNFFYRFVTQEALYLLGNGVTWKNEGTKEKLGADFDTKLQKAGRAALVGGCAFGFWNLDHLEVFEVTEFVPLYDEESGALCAGIRFWQLDGNKPLRATLYELDGYTDYLWQNGRGEVKREKTPYKVLVARSGVDGETVRAGENYPAFPIVPLWGNPHHQSEIVGIRAGIDAYDLIKSGFANNIDDARMFWIIKNAGGMDDVDLKQFIERMHTVGAASLDADAGVGLDATTQEIPYESREKLLDRISSDLYRDYMALDTATIAGGAATATQIRAAYEPMNNKADQFEYCILSFVHGILAVAGIDDEPTFTRSNLINVQEDIQSVLLAAEYLDEEYLVKKLLTLLGDGDMAPEVLGRRDAEDQSRFSAPAGDSA